MLLTYTDSCCDIPTVRHFKARPYAQFSTGANKDKILSKVLFRAIQWKHRKAKSFTIFDFMHTDYHGFPVDAPLDGVQFASFKVRYYNKANEGMFKIVDLTEDQIWDQEIPIDVYT